MTDDFLALEVRHHDIGEGAIAYRVVGEGPPILLVHGWPLWGFTWRKMLPTLARAHRCVIVDLLGAGQSRWSARTNFTMTAQARAIASLLEALDIEGANVIAHDTGATIVRHLALIAPERVARLVLMGTEIPNHRPPGVELFVRFTHVPGSGALVALLLRSRHIARSAIGFGSCFADRSLIDGEFRRHIIDPLIHDARARNGQIAYARGIDWRLVDSLARDHGRIRQPTLLLWGENDPFFPVERAREMVSQLGDCRGFETYPGRLFIHEELPAEIAERAARFFEEAGSPAPQHHRTAHGG